MKKLPLLLAAGAGYVLGAKAGRERYEQIRTQANRLTHDPRVQRRAREAADAVKDQAPIVKDKVSGAASAAASKVRSSDASGRGTSTGPDAPITNSPHAI